MALAQRLLRKPILSTAVTMQFVTGPSRDLPSMQQKLLQKEHTRLREETFDCQLALNAEYMAIKLQLSDANKQLEQHALNTQQAQAEMERLSSGADELGSQKLHLETQLANERAAAQQSKEELEVR